MHIIDWAIELLIDICLIIKPPSHDHFCVGILVKRCLGSALASDMASHTPKNTRDKCSIERKLFRSIMHDGPSVPALGVSAMPLSIMPSRA